MKPEHYAIKILSLAVDCLEADETPDTSVGVVSDMIVEFESEKVKELQDRLDAICTCVDMADSISKVCCLENHHDPR